MSLTSRSIVVLAALLASSANARGQVIYAGPAWAAVDLGPVCEARSAALLKASRGKAQANAGFAFSADRARWGEFHIQLSRNPRPGSAVLLTIGDQPFLLVAARGWAWSRGPRQEQAIIASARAAGGMRVEARDAAGRRFVDSYSLAGAPTAIDAAAAACAGKMQRR